MLDLDVLFLRLDPACVGVVTCCDFLGECECTCVTGVARMGWAFTGFGMFWELDRDNFLFCGAGFGATLAGVSQKASFLVGVLGAAGRVLVGPEAAGTVGTLAVAGFVPVAVCASAALAAAALASALSFFFSFLILSSFIQ